MCAPARPGTNRSPVNAGRAGRSARRSGSLASVPTRVFDDAGSVLSTKIGPVFLDGFSLRIGDDRPMQHASPAVGQRRPIRVPRRRLREARIAEHLLQATRAEAPVDAALARLGLGGLDAESDPGLIGTLAIDLVVDDGLDDR